MSAFHPRCSCILVLASLPLVIIHAAPAAEQSTRRDCFGDPLPDEALYRIGSARFRLGSPVRFLAFSKDGKTLLSVNRDNICRWDAASGKQLHKVERSGGGYDAFSPDGKLLAALSHDRGGGPIWIGDASTGRFLRHLEARGAKGGVAFGPDSRMLAAAGDKGVIHLWNPISGTVLGELKGEDTSCSALAFSPDGKMLASAHQDDAVRLWDVLARRQLRRLPSARENDWTERLLFSPDGKLLAAQGRHELRLWNAATGQKVWAISRGGYSHSPLAFSPDGTVIALENDYGIVCLVRVATGKEIRRLKRWDDVNCLAFSPDGKWLAVGGENVRVHRVASGEELRPAGDGALDIDRAAFAPDGRLLITSETNGTIRLWDADTGAPVRRFQGDPKGNSFVGFSADGKSLIARVGYVGEERYSCWNLKSGKELTLTVPPPGAYCDALSSSGRFLAWSHHDFTVHLEDAVRGTELRSWRTKLEIITHFSFSSDDRLLAMVSWAGESEIRTVATGTECSHLKSPHEFLGFSRDGRIIARLIRAKRSPLQQMSDPDGPIYFQDTATGEVLAQSDKQAMRAFPGDFAGSVHAAVFSPDSRMFATIAQGEPVRFWETATGKERYRLPSEQSGYVEQLAFAPDGNKFVTTGAAQFAVVWHVFGPRPGQHPSDLSAAEQRTLWANLASGDGQIAFRAIRALTSSPRSAVELLRREVSPVPRLDPQRLAHWIAELDADDFIVREKATLELRKRGLAVEEALRRVLRNRPTLEARRRLEQLLADLHKQRTAADTIRKGRALEVLEHLSTPEAGRLLEELARGEPAARLTCQVQASLERLRNRPAKP